MIWTTTPTGEEELLIPGRSRYFVDSFSQGIWKVTPEGTRHIRYRHEILAARYTGRGEVVEVVEGNFQFRTLKDWEKGMATSGLHPYVPRVRELTPKQVEEWKERMRFRRRTLTPPIRRRMTR